MKQTLFSLVTLSLAQYPPILLAEPTANPNVLLLCRDDQQADTIAALGNEYDSK